MKSRLSTIRTAFAFVCGIALVPVVTQAQSPDMPTKERTSGRTLPDDSALRSDSESKKQLQEVLKQLDASRAAFSAGQPAPVQATPGTSSASRVGADPAKLAAPLSGPTGSSAPNGTPQTGALVPGNDLSKAVVATPIEDSPTGAKARKSGRSKKPPIPGAFVSSQPFVAPVARGSGLQTFAVSTKARGADDVPDGFTVLPTGSHVKARMVSGVEANAREPYPVLLQLDYAFTGPNDSRIELSNCFMIAKARANMSTERVMMETDSLSCVRENGEHFKREAKGFVAGEDNTFGATGTYISKQGQVLLAAVLASIAKNAGQAIADAQKVTTITGADKAATATNITGNKAAYIGGAAMVDGASLVAQWYLEQAKELLPSIGVGSGQDVFVIMLDTVSVPTLSVEE